MVAAGVRRLKALTEDGYTTSKEGGESGTDLVKIGGTQCVMYTNRMELVIRPILS